MNWHDFSYFCLLVIISTCTKDLIRLPLLAGAFTWILAPFLRGDD